MDGDWDADIVLIEVQVEGVVVAVGEDKDLVLELAGNDEQAEEWLRMLLCGKLMGRMAVSTAMKKVDYRFC